MIDVSKIKGYEEMTAEEKIEALVNFETNDLSKLMDENKNLKNLISKANSESADWKKKFRDTQSEVDKANAEKEEQFKALLEENKTLKMQSKIDGYAKQYVSRGYDEELANSTALALANGDMDVVFANEKAYEENLRKQLKADAVGKQSELGQSMPPTKEQLEKAELESIFRAAGL